MWIVLYCLMGTAAWLVSRERYHDRRSAALAAYFLQLALNDERVNLKATTAEHLGFIGRREGLVAMATVLIDGI